MLDGFPVKLGFFAKRDVVDLIPGRPEGRWFGVVSSGIAMPSGGVGYAAEFDSPKAARAKILAYIDAYGRVYSCDSVLQEPPQRECDLALYAVDFEEGNASANAAENAAIDEESNAGASDGGSEPGCVSARLDAISASGERRCVADLLVRDADDIRAAALKYVAVDSAFPGDFKVRRESSYAEFMAVAYLAFIEFAHMNESAGEQAEADVAFDMGAVFARFATPDFFDAANKEVLEAESSWAEHPEKSCAVERFLVHGLRESGVVGVDSSAFRVDGALDGPHARIVRTRRYADMFYIDFYYNTESTCIEDGAFKTSDATRDVRRRLLLGESALNRFFLLARFLEQNDGDFFEKDDAAISELDSSFVELVCVQAPDPSNPLPSEGRWQLHLEVARAAESWRLPYRLPYEFCLNEACSEVAFNLATPESATMAQSTWDAEQECYAALSGSDAYDTEARYAAHAALLAAACAFHVGAGIEKVSVNCFRGGNVDDAVISATFDRERFCIAYAEDEGHVFPHPFKTLAYFDARFNRGADNRLSSIAPLFELGKERFSCDFERTVALDETPFNDTARKLFNTDCPARMSIFEDALRRKYADEVNAALDEGVDAAVSCLKSIHDRSEDLLVRRICSQLIEAFEFGELNETSFLEAKGAFTDAFGMKAAMMRAAQLMRDNDPSAVGLLEELAAQGDAIEGFEDTTRHCYRYFDSYESRAIYAKRCGGDANGRMVSPLPDEAFVAHDSLAQELASSMMDADEALEHARRCIELAPSRAYSYLRAARAYFMKDDFSNEAAMCCKALEVSWNSNDASLALYWLAFSFWKLEKYAASAACYKRCIALGGSMTLEAKNELEELCSTVKGLKRLTPEQESELLIKEGVPVDALDENAAFLLQAAEAAVDSSAVSLGCVLAASSARVERDDAIIPVVRALNVTMG